MRELKVWPASPQLPPPSSPVSSWKNETDEAHRKKILQEHWEAVKFNRDSREQPYTWCGNTHSNDWGCRVFPRDAGPHSRLAGGPRLQTAQGGNTVKQKLLDLFLSKLASCLSSLSFRDSCASPPALSSLPQDNLLEGEH